MMVCAQWGSVMTDSNKSEDDLPEFPGSNQTIKLTISNHELFYILCVVFPGAGRRLTTLTYSQLGLGLGVDRDREAWKSNQPDF